MWRYRPLLFLTMASINAELNILLEAHGAFENSDFLATPIMNCMIVSQFACIVSKEEHLVSEFLDLVGLARVEIGDRIACRTAWHVCCNTLKGGAGSVSAGPSTVSKMPDGSEARLRTAVRALHKFHMSGGWLANEHLIARMYKGLIATPKCLYVPDISSIGRRSALSPKPIKGTLTTNLVIDNIGFTLNTCTNHPDTFSRLRAYTVTVVFLSITTPEFFTYESADEVVDYIFEAINLRAEGKRPSIECMTQGFCPCGASTARASNTRRRYLSCGSRRRRTGSTSGRRASSPLIPQVPLVKALHLPLHLQLLQHSLWTSPI